MLNKINGIDLKNKFLHDMIQIHMRVTKYFIAYIA